MLKFLLRIDIPYYNFSHRYTRDYLIKIPASRTVMEIYRECLSLQSVRNVGSMLFNVMKKPRSASENYFYLLNKCLKKNYIT